VPPERGRHPPPPACGPSRRSRRSAGAQPHAVGAHGKAVRDGHGGARGGRGVQPHGTAAGTRAVAPIHTATGLPLERAAPTAGVLRMRWNGPLGGSEPHVMWAMPCRAAAPAGRCRHGGRAPRGAHRPRPAHAHCRGRIQRAAAGPAVRRDQQAALARGAVSGGQGCRAAAGCCRVVWRGREGRPGSVGRSGCDGAVRLWVACVSAGGRRGGWRALTAGYGG
jgi:hypothetical protein